MQTKEKFIFSPSVSLALCFAATVLVTDVHAQDIGPALEQEYVDAKGALEAARKGQAETRAAAQIKLAQESLQSADEARQGKDGAKFGQSARIARAYSELAVAVADYAAEAEKLTTTNDALQKAKAEIERLTK